MKLRQVTLIVLASAVGLFGVFLLVIPINIYTFGHNRIEKSDEVGPAVVIVFGAGLRPDGSPSDALGDRLEIAAKLYAEDPRRQLLVSGDNSFENYNEPQVMHDTLMATYNIPDDQIFIDFAGRRTYDTCVRAHDLWRIDQAILVSQAFHLPRAIWTCEKLGIDSVGVSASLRSYVRDSYYRHREILAMYKAWFDVNIWEPNYLTGEFEVDL